MNNFQRLTFAVAIATASLGTTVAASADDAMMKSDSMMKIDCSQAGSMMSTAAKAAPTAMMTGDTDKDFMAIAMEREKGTMMIMKIEASCGKDPKTKAMAAKQAAAASVRMEMFRNQNMSQ